MSDEEQLAIQRIAQPQKFICVTGVWEPPNKHETTHSRRDGNEWFSPFIPTKALLASSKKRFVTALR